MPLHFRDADGKWQRIDPTLKRTSDGALTNTAGPLSVQLPSDATGAVRVGSGAHTVSFRLRDTRSSAAKVETDRASYSEALPHVSADYEVGRRSLKETIWLRSADVPASFVFDVGLSPGLTMRTAPDGDLKVADDAGRTVYTMAAPWMRDAAGAFSRAARYEIAGSGDARVLRLTIDRSWLASDRRRFPVQVDPTIYPGPELVCELVDGTGADISRCGGSEMTFWVGRENGRRHRVVAKYDLAAESEALPPTDIVQEAAVAFWFNGGQGPSPSSVELEAFALQHPFDTDATWNSPDGSGAWNGGDIAAEPDARQRLEADWNDWWSGIGIARLAQGWLDASQPNNGVLIKAADEQAGRIDTLAAMHMSVVHTPRLGYNGSYTFEEFDLGPTAGLSVNVGNGNLVVRGTDASVASDGSSLEQVRYWNSLGTGEVGEYGVDQAVNYGADVRLNRDWVTGNYVLLGSAFETAVFYRRPDGSFTAPSELDAQLEEHQDDTLSLTFAETGEVWHFDAFSSHYLDTIEYPNGYVIDLHYDVNGLRQLTHTEGGALSLVDGEPDGLADTLTDGNGGSWSYTRDGDDRLTQVAAPTGQTEYTYTNGLITGVEAPGGQSAEIAYDNAGRVESVTTSASGQTQVTTSFAYQPPATPCDVQRTYRMTVVTATVGSSRTYCYDTHLRSLETPDVDQLATDWYADEYNVSTATARDWMATQDRAEGINEEIAASSSGTGYAGVWFDNSTRRVKLGIKSGTSSAPLQALAASHDIEGRTDVVTVAYSDAQLQDGVEAVGNQLADLVEDGTVNVGRRLSSNSVRIDVAGKATAGERSRVAQAASGASVAVTVANSSENDLSITPTVELDCFFPPGGDPGCDRPLRGGVRIRSLNTDKDGDRHACTAGFMARGRVARRLYVLTVGHCMKNFDDDDSSWSALDLVGTERRIGSNVNPYVFGDDGDAALIRVEEDSFWRSPLSSFVFVTRSRTGSTTRDPRYYIRAVRYNQEGRVICNVRRDKRQPMRRSRGPRRAGQRWSAGHSREAPRQDEGLWRRRR